MSWLASGLWPALSSCSTRWRALSTLPGVIIESVASLQRLGGPCLGCRVLSWNQWPLFCQPCYRSEHRTRRSSCKRGAIGETSRAPFLALYILPLGFCLNTPPPPAHPLQQPPAVSH